MRIKSLVLFSLAAVVLSSFRPVNAGSEKKPTPTPTYAVGTKIYPTDAELYRYLHYSTMIEDGRTGLTQWVPQFASNHRFDPRDVWEFSATDLCAIYRGTQTPAPTVQPSPNPTPTVPAPPSKDAR